MSSNVIPLIQVSVFWYMKWMSSFRLFYLSLFCIKIRAIAKEYTGKDWRTIKFRRDHSIQLKKNAYCVFICQRTNLRGECQHAVCQECHEEHSKAQKRSRGGVPSEKELMMSCHHELRNLQLCADIWWCTKDYIEHHQWSERVKGCAFCERMFIVGDVWEGWLKELVLL